MNIYKHLNLFFYRFAQILWVEGILAFVIGLFYLIIVLAFDDTFIFDMNTFIFSILYILIPITTGTSIIQEYIDSNSNKKNKRKSKNKFIQLKIEK
jgi:membrane protein required for beta-lactamase induction